MNGWIKLHRSLTKWEWVDDPKTLVLFIHLLLMANHEDKKWRGILIKKGELITSLSKLSKNTGLSIQSVRTALANIKSTQEVTQFRNTKYTHISINNWDKYQSPNTVANTKTNKVLTTNKNYKKIRSIGKPLKNGKAEEIRLKLANQFGFNDLCNQ